jgi:16S rRNA processing protein RimM
VGLVRGVHGLKGGVRVEVLSDRPERFDPGAVLFEEGSSRPLTVAESVDDPPGLLVRFREVRTREAAEGLRDVYLEAAVEPAALEEGAAWWHEVEGATVTTTGGETLGRVEEVFRVGESEVFAVRGAERGEVLVPAVRDVVVDFAPREGRLVVDAEALDLAPVRPRRPRGRKSSRRLPEA